MSKENMEPSDMPIPNRDGSGTQLYEEEEITAEYINNLKEKITADERIDAVYRMTETLTETFDNRAYLHPHGMTCYDYPSVPKERRAGLEDFKMKVRRENYEYLGKHPELDALIELFLQNIMKEQPANTIHYAAEFFSLRNKNLEAFKIELEEEKKSIHSYRGAHPKVKFEKGLSEWNTIEDLNQLKKLNIGPLAKDIDFSQLTDRTKPVETDAPVPLVQGYCGCKNKDRRAKAHPPNPQSQIKPTVDPVPKEEEQDNFYYKFPQLISENVEEVNNVPEHTDEEEEYEDDEEEE